MKRYTSFLCSLLLAVFAMAQSETTIINVVPGDGNYNGTGWCSNWTSTSVDYTVAITVGVNNLYAATTSDGFQMARGTNADSDWTFSVAGYKVVSYSFKFKSYENGKDVTLSATNADGSAVSMTSSYSTEQTFSIDCSNAATATFRISGSNYSIIATDLTLTVRPAQALTSLEVGQVYRFVNVLYPTYSLNANAANDVNSVTTSETDTKQQWYVEKQDGEYYVLRNLAYGKYLKGNGQSSAWSMSDDYSHNCNKFKLYTSNTDYNTLHTNTLGDYAYIHCNSSYNIVGWSNDTTDKGSHWEITKVDYTDEEIAALLEKAPTVAEVAAYPAALEAIFSDAACTILNSAYTTTSMTDEQLAANANYLALPQTLKNMVKKVRGGDWAEKTVDPADRPNGNNSSNVPESMWTVEDTWEHEYAKKFRVQMYEPYSVEGEITSFLGINAHCNMDNPTGIYANAGESIYIMVEGDIAEGAELWVAHQTGHGVTSYYNNAAYTQLEKGLNVIPYDSDGCQLWINYLVHTYNTSTGEFPHKLSDYKPLKIHIEGGHINGFFNAMGDFRSTEVTGDANGGENLWGEVDNDADWDYYKARAALATDFALLGHRQTLLFPFGTWNSTNGYFGVANDGGGIEKALAWHLENISVPTTPNCYAGSGNAFGNFSDTYYPGMNLDAETGEINIMLEAWDRIMYSEHATMGLLSKSNIDKMNSLYPGWTAENTTFDIYNYGSNDTGDTYKAFCEGRDYSDYYNHHGAAVGSGSGYMSGGWRVCNYHYNTMGSIIGKIAVEAGPTWGPAHEIGHQHQAIFNLNGQTEVTNNFFSNVAVWYMGMGTSRVNGTDGSLASVLDAFNTEDNDLYTNNIWAITHLYYRLWLYYHLAGNNTQFWPRLFELLRQTPMVNGGQISGETSLLRFYQHACDAAGEDLTEFFRAHGFFELMTNRLVGDYSNATYNVTEEQIETAITAVEANNYPKNYAILLINDGTSDTTVKHDGTSKRALWDGSASAEYGSVTDFIEGNTSITTAYDAVVSADGTVTMSGGAGGVGFLVFNENGELVSFSNKSTFELSDEAKKTILQGNATFVAVDSENNTTTAEIDLTEMQKNILGELIAKAQQIIDKIDDTYTKIGFYKGAAVADLAAALENAKTVYDAGTSGYGGAYDLLYAEYNKLLENEDARIPFDPSLTYIITNKAYTNETMWVNDTLTVRSEGAVDQAADAAKWQFKPTASGAYNIYNMKGYYCPAVSQSASMIATETPNADALYTLQEMEAGVWAIKLSPAEGYRNFHSSWSNVVGWETGNDATRWYLTAVEPNATIADLTNLEVYITKTEALLGEVLGTVTYTKGDNITLQTTTEGSAGYIWSNAPCATEGTITNLVDGATNNYFHTEWNGDAVTSGDHYIAVDLGAGNTLSRFAFSHTTRSGVQSDFPKSVDVYGSDDNVTYKYLGSASDMSQSAGAFWQFDGMIISSHRYLRFNMHANRGYWHMAEFDIMPVIGFTATVNDTYSSTVNVETLTAALEAMYNGKSVALSMSPTEDNINERLQALTSAYNALYTEYSAAITERKKTLAQLAANTKVLIDQAGTVEIIPTIEAKLQTTEPDGDFYVSTNAQSSQEGPIADLVDGNNNTFFHSDYSGNNSSDGLDHSINIKLGEAKATKLFEFSYVTRHNADTDYPTAMTVYGSTNGADYEMITSFTGLPASQTATYGPVLIECSKEYTYLRFMVTENSSNTDKGGHPFFHMAEFDLTTIGSTTTTINSKYKSVVTEELLLASVHTTNSSVAMSTNELVTSVPMLDAQIADQQAAYDKLNEAMQQATCDKTELQAAYDEALALYNKMADGEGNVTANYAPSTLTVEQLAAAKTALDAAKDKLDNSDEQGEIDTAKGNLETAFEPLNTVESLNVAATKDKSTLNALIASTNTLLGTINGNIENNENYYAGVDGLALDELNTALQNAQDAVSRYYLTETQYTAAYEALNDCYTATNAVVIADVAKDELKTLITTMENLLATTTVSGAQTAGSLPLQVTDKTESFYILTYPRATDDNGKGAIIDETDGVGNTGTFTGTYWESSSEAYSHYVEIDLGVNTVIEDFSIDYTTRYSGAADSRPTGLKFYGSNDKETYTELFSVTEGLPTTENTKWEMSAPYELAKNYRYIRVAVASGRGGCFNMSDFNLYSHCTAMVNQNYSTSDIFDYLPAALREYCNAKEAVGKYLVAGDCTAAKEQLQEQIDAIQSVIDSNINERGGLETLANETNALVTKVATINEAETAITMQCTDENAPYYLYCNADNSTNDSAGDNDKVGVAALVGDNATNTTHLHTTYGGNAQDDDLDHYLRLDMGENEAMMSFKFRYTGRDNNVDNAPTKMIVEGSNDLENFDEIAKLEIAVPESGTATYETTEALGNGKAYRYIRFMVTETRNGANNNANNNGHPFFVLSQFAVTACKTMEVNSEYASPKLPLTTLVTANNEVVEAGIVVEQFYTTQEAYDNSYAELEAAKGALEVAATADKTALNNLIEATTLLKGQLYEIASYTANEVTLQNTNASEAGYIYCNAPGSTNNYSGDNLGVAALLDNDTNTSNFLHTTYNGNNNEDGLDHYLRVYLGEAGTDYIEFRYTGRSGHPKLTPKMAIIEATNDLNSEWVTIATLTNLAATTDGVSTGCLGNGTVYRYWRFMVTKTNDGRMCDNHPYFALSAFNVYKCTNVELSEQLKYTPNIYIYVTDDLVTEVTDAIGTATIVKDNADATQAAVDAAVDALQPVHDKLEEALKYAGIPVEITTDEANPVLYKIISKRADDGSKVLQYCEFDAANPKTVSVSDKIANNSYQAWYFMESAYGVVIKPFNGDGKVLGADDTGDGHTKVWAVEEGEKPYYEWNFVISTDGYYNIQVYDGSSYLSNYAGTSNKIGFYASNPAGDLGSLFMFVKAEFENDNARYYQLSDFENTLEYQTADTPEGTTVGAFTNGNAYSAAYTTASTLIEASNTSAATDCYAAYTALRAASLDIEKIVPEAGQIYRIYITPGLTDNRAGASMRIGDNGKLACGEYSAANTEYYFAFEYDADGNLYMKSLHSGTYLDEAPGDKTNTAVGADAESITDENSNVIAKSIAINTLGKSGDAVVVGIVPTGGAMLNCAGITSNVVAYNNTAVDKASAWVIEEVTPETVTENIKQSVTLTESNDGNKYSTLYLGYNATIPEGVTASIVTGLNSIGQLILEDVTGAITNGADILPAKTAVVLSGEVDGTKDFAYAETDDEFDTSANILKGTAYTKIVDCRTSSVYMLGRKNSRVAFYRAYENFNAEGVKQTVNGTTNHNESGYVKCNANKSYLQIDDENVANSQAAAAMFSFFFGGNTTDIESINAVAEAYEAVYDLQGRKLEKVTEPGIYIVNGKKVYVSEVE